MATGSPPKGKGEGRRGEASSLAGKPGNGEYHTSQCEESSSILTSNFSSSLSLFADMGFARNMMSHFCTFERMSQKFCRVSY